MRKSRKGMTLVEVLITMVISAIIVAVISVIISFSNKTLRYTDVLIEDTDVRYDSGFVLDRYIRESKSIVLDASRKCVFIIVPKSIFNPSNSGLTNMILYVDENDNTLCLDTKLSELGIIILAENVAEVNFSLICNGLGYTVKNEGGLLFYGYSYKRSR